ncbi:MAG: PAS domain-containing protein, partial [Thermoleophilia bacterium]|nr:PAS domain-containing protein [Thermoleophilia bacterium]
LAVLDQALRYVSINDALATINGLPAADHIGRPVSEVLPRLWTSLEPVIRHVLESGESVTDVEVSGRSEHRPGPVLTCIVNIFALRAPGRGIVGLGIAVLEITARKRAEDLMRLGAEAAGLGILQIDYAADAATPDATAAALFGLEPGVAVPIADVHARFHPDERAEVNHRIGRSLDPSGDGGLELEHRVALPDGSVRWLGVRKKTTFDADGRPASAVLAVVDATTRKEAEAGAEEARRRLEKIMQATPDLVYLYEARSGRNLFVSDAAAPLLGRTPDSLRVLDGRMVGELFHPDDAEAGRRARDRNRALADGEVGEGEYRLRHADGSYRWALIREVVFSRDEDGSPALMLAVATDITARKEAADALRAGEERLRLAVEATGVGIFDLDPATGRHVLSEQARQIWGFPAGVDPDAPALLAAVHPDDRGAVRAAWSAPDPASSGFSVEHRLVRPDGEVRWASTSARTIFDDAGRPLRTIGTMLDVTERRRFEERLRESEAFARQVSDVAPSILYVYDLEERRNVWANRETYSLLGYSRTQLDAMAGDLMGVLMHPDDLAPYLEHIGRLLRLADGEAAEFEYRMRDASGGWRWLFSRDMPFRRSATGEVTQIIGAALDITDRRRFEEALRAGEQQLRLALEASDAGVWSWDAATGIPTWDERNHRL